MSYPPVFEPSQLRPFLAAGHGLDPDDIYSTFPRGTGHYRKRRIATIAPRRVSVQRVLTPAEMAAYDDWFETNIVVGQTHFTALIANNEGSGQVWFDACWIEPYQTEPVATPQGVFWRLAGRLLLTGEGTQVRPDDGTLAVEYVAHLNGSAEVFGTHLLAVEYSAHLTSAMMLSVEYAADLESTQTVFIPAPNQNIVLQGLAPSIFRSSILAPGAGAITISGLAPPIAASRTAAPGAGTITVTGLAPTAGANTSISPGAGTITTAGLAPTITSNAGALDPYSSNLWAAYGITRQRSSAVYSGAAIRVRKSTGGDTTTEQDIGFSGSALDTASLATFAGSETVVVTKLYDQSGNGRDLVQATGANQPRIVNAGTYDGFLRFDGTNDDMATSATTGTGTVFSGSLKANYRTSTTQVVYRIGDGVGAHSRAMAYVDSGQGGTVCLTQDVSSNTAGNKTVLSPPIQRVWGYIHDLAGASNALRARIFVNGSEQSTAVVFTGTTSGNYTAQTLLVGSGSGVNWAAIDLYSLAIWESQQSANMAGIGAAMA